MVDLPDPKARVVGMKQVLRAIEKSNLKSAVIAQDADDYMLNKIKSVLEQNNVPYKNAESMLELGKACGIEVGATVVGELITV